MKEYLDISKSLAALEVPMPTVRRRDGKVRVSLTRAGAGMANGAPPTLGRDSDAHFEVTPVSALSFGGGSQT